MMKKLTLALVIFVLFAGSALAAVQDITVSANVVGTCQFNSKTDVAFGALDQTSAADETAAGGLNFWCTKNANYELTDEANSTTVDGTFAGTMTSGADTIAYGLAYTNTSGSGGGKTAPISSAITGTILNANYVDAPAGNYSDTVTFTVVPAP